MSTKQTKLEFDRIDAIGGPENHRMSPIDMDAPDIKALALSILDMGLLQPLVVREHKIHNPEPGQRHRRYTLIAGRRRHAAISRIRIKNPTAFEKVPVVTWSGNDSAASMASFAENMDRKSLTSAEVAKGLQQLSNMGHTPALLAKRFERSPTWVYNHIKVVEGLTNTAFNALHDGQITFEEALKLLKVEEPEQNDVVERLIQMSRPDDGSRTDQAVLALATTALPTTPESTPEPSPPVPAKRPAPSNHGAKKRKTRSAERKKILNKATGTIQRRSARELKEALEYLGKDARPISKTMTPQEWVSLGIRYSLGELDLSSLV